MNEANLAEHLKTQYSLVGRTALVTGATGLVGNSVAVGLARLGANIVASYHSNDEAAYSLKENISSFGGTCITFKSDLSTDQGINELKKFTLAHSKRIDILVPCAGIKKRGSVMFDTSEDIHRMFLLNVQSIMLLARACLRPMSSSQWGRIVLIGSRAGTFGLPGQALYSATKSALIAWATAVAGEVGHNNITVNIISPGAISDPSEKIYSDTEKQKITEFIANRRLANVDEIANAVCFLCSPAATYINGTTLAVDGGARF